MGDHEGTSSIVAAVLDSGIDYGYHNDLIANRWQNYNDPSNGVDDDGNGIADDVWGYDFVDNDKKPYDDHGHGTHVAGIIGADADNSLGVAGVACDVRLLPVKVADSNGNLDAADVIDGMNYVKDLRYAGANIRVANMSFGFNYAPTGMQRAIADLGTASILVVAAAGNSASNIDSTPVYPAAYNNDNIITVAATTHSDALAGFSNYGSSRVDLGAPGDDIASTYYDAGGAGSNQYAVLDGTSMAAPMVAGAAVLALSLKPDMTYQQVRTAILNSVDTKSSLSGKVATGGRLNVNGVIDYVLTNYGNYNKVVIGDANGVRTNDNFLVRPKPGDSTKTEVCRVVGGTTIPIATTDNQSGKTIAIFTLSGFSSGTADTVTVANGVNNRLYIKGSEGNDFLQGGLNGDTIDGANGNDTIYGSGGADNLGGAGGNDKIWGDVLHGTGGDDTIVGSAGNDSLYGAEGNDSITGGSGNDSVEGGIGNDILRFSGDGFVDVGSGGSGNDTLDIDTAGAIVDSITQ